MLYHHYCRVILFHVILLNEYQFHNAKNSTTNGIDDPSHQIVIQLNNNRRFFLNAMKITWVDAVSKCKQNGMILGEVKTMNEAKILTQKMLMNRPVAIENAWIGGYKSSQQNGSINWKWMSNGEKIDDNNDLWMKPLAVKIKTDSQSSLPDQHCLLLDWHLLLGTNPSYVEIPCNRKRGFICQSLNRSIIKNLKSAISELNSTNKSIIPEISTTQHRSSPTLESTYLKTTFTSTIRSTTSVNKKKKRNKKKVKDFTTLPPTTISATTDEVYLDYRMWELGEAQMKLWMEKDETDHLKKFKHGTIRNNSESVQISKVPESNYDFITTRMPDVILATIRKPLKSLKLYYAFEGPMVGGLTATPMPHEQIRSDTGNISARRYHKYISKQRYNQYMEKKKKKKQQNERY